MRLITTLTTAAVLMSATASAADLDLTLNNKTASIGLNSYFTPNGKVGIDYLYKQDVGHKLAVKTVATGFKGAHQYEVGLKMNQFWFKYAPNGNAVGVGGEYRYHFNRDFVLGGSYYFAPEVLSFGDIKSFSEGQIKAGLKLDRNIELNVGYRNTLVGYRDMGSYRFDDTFFFGANLTF